MRELQVASTQEEQEQPVRRGSWMPQDRFLDFFFHGETIVVSDSNLTGVHTIVPDLIRDVDKKCFVGARGNAAFRVLQLEHKHTVETELVGMTHISMPSCGLDVPVVLPV